MGVIWGIPYLLIKVAVRQVSPVDLVFFRTTIGAVLLVPVAVARGDLRPALRRWLPIVAYTTLEMGVPWVLLSTAEERLPSSLSGLLIAAVPLVGVPIGLLLGRRDVVHRRGMVGLLVGLGGVAALLGFDIGAGQVGSVALVAVVVVGYAAGPAVADRWLGDVPVLGVVASSLLLCAAAYAPFALTDLPRRMDGAVTASVLTLGVVCTAVAFVLFFALIAEIGAVRATVITYLNPAVAVVLGVAFLGERFGVATGVGFALILAGSWLGTRHGPVPEVAEVAPASGPQELLDRTPEG